jgi:hypothetical protein
MSSSERAEYTLTSAALTQPAAINAAPVASDNSCFLIIDSFLNKSNYLILAFDTPSFCAFRARIMRQVCSRLH